MQGIETTPESNIVKGGEDVKKVSEDIVGNVTRSIRQFYYDNRNLSMALGFAGIVVLVVWAQPTIVKKIKL
jgi:hypothetical protein